MKIDILDYALKRVQSPPPPVTEAEKEAVVTVARVLNETGCPLGKIRFFEDANFFCILKLNETSSLRFSAYYPLFTIDGPASFGTNQIESIVHTMQKSGFFYISKADLGGEMLRWGDLTKDNLFNRLFGYYSD
jgi:hypothetical protein